MLRRCSICMMHCSASPRAADSSYGGGSGAYRPGGAAYEANTVPSSPRPFADLEPDGDDEALNPDVKPRGPGIMSMDDDDDDDALNPDARPRSGRGGRLGVDFRV